MKTFNKSVVLALIAFMFIAFSADSYSQLIKTVVSVTGTVFNEVSKQPASVKITVTDLDGNKITTSKSNASDGYYLVTGLKPGTSYLLKIDEKGFFAQNFRIDLPKSNKYVEISRDFLVKPMVEGEQISFKIPPFEFNKSELRNGADFILNDMTYALIANPRVEFTIMCYPDNSVSKKFNAKLTDERAKALQEYFINKGISLKRMTIQAFDAGDPINPIPTEKKAKGKRYIGPVYIKVTKF